MSDQRVAGLAVTVFSLSGADVSADLENGDLYIENKDVEAKGIKERWDYPYPVATSWRIEVDVFVSTVATLMTAAAGAGSGLPVVATTGANSYSGNVMVSTAGHSFHRDELQMQKVVLKGQGALTIA